MEPLRRVRRRVRGMTTPPAIAGSNMSKLIVYPDPLDSVVRIESDSGWFGILTPYTHTDGRKGQAVDVPDDIQSGWGSRLTVSHGAKVTFSNRGFLVNQSGAWRFLLDDVTLLDVPKPCPPCPDCPPVDPPHNMPSDPKGIIDWTFTHGTFDLASKDGCGRFTEACCTNLHNGHAAAWGHVRKSGAQNQFNGHAVDAVMLLVPHQDGTRSGIYDLIFSSESTSAKPTFNYAGAVEQSLWYYPAAPLK